MRHTSGVWHRAAGWLILGMLAFDPVHEAAAETDSVPRPNIVFVLFDDMGFGEPPSFRTGSEFKTPNLDRLAREGMRFTDAHSAAAVCTPTRYGVLTGRYPSRIGQFGVLTTFSPPIIPPERMTVASLLKSQGFQTACIGKWHLGLNWTERPKPKHELAPIGARFSDGPNALGFDHFAGFTHSRQMGTLLEQDAVVAHLQPVDVQPALAQRAVDWIDARKTEKRPFFLYLPLGPPHTPIVPAEEFVGRSGGDKYADWILQGDAILGQILTALDRNGLSENTLLIATSDNGAAGRPYPPLRGSKASIYEGGHRVPYVVRWPNVVRAGAVCDETICLNDLLATAAEIVGVTLPANAGEDSISILPYLRETADSPVRQTTIHQSHAGDLALRRGPWKLIFFKNGNRELYNLASDPGEQHNLASDQSDIVAELTNSMQSLIDNGRSTPGAAQKNDAPDTLPPRGKEK